MRYVLIDNKMAQRVSSQDGTAFVVQPSVLNGIVHVEGFIDPARHIGRDRGYVEFIYSFASLSGEWYRYRTLLHPARLWPRQSTTVRPGTGSFKKDITIKVLLDTTGEPPLRFPNGETYSSAHKYNDLTFQIRCDERALAVRMTHYAGELFSSASEAYQTVDYELEYTDLLWLRAARVSDGDVLPEAEPYASIVRLGMLSDAGVPDGLKPSPIEVAP